jgi:hypothetical protein
MRVPAVDPRNRSSRFRDSQEAGRLTEPVALGFVQLRSERWTVAANTRRCESRHRASRAFDFALGQSTRRWVESSQPSLSLSASGVAAAAGSAAFVPIS